MTPVRSFAGKRVAVVGLGGSGLATLAALQAGGASIAAWDDGVSARERAAQAGFAVEDLRQADWSVFAALVLAPGVPLTHPEPHWSVLRAQAANVPVIGDIELFQRERASLAPTAPFVAITGTNGKSTTTALIAHILKSAGRDVALGGNIGTPILALPPPAPGRIHVIECSTFQIDLAPSLAPSIGLLINLTPDHLDRHGTMEAYAAIKERLVANADVALVGVDDHYCRAIYARVKQAKGSEAKAVSAQRVPDADVWVDGHRVFEKGGPAPAVDLAEAKNLRGAHNGQNAAFAFAATRALGLSLEEIRAGMRSFPGLAHRMEQVGRRGRVLFVNDSKATNADAAEKALLTFNDIFWILGGKAKQGGIEPLRPLFKRVAKAYLIGDASDTFAHSLDGEVAFERCGTLDNAVAEAARDAALSAAAEPVVLLSPACASYDQFANFEQRGDRFRERVTALLAARKESRMISRAQVGPVADWMRTADKWLLAAFGALMVAGLVLALAASPAVAERIGLSPFHFVDRQALFMAPTAALMIATSFLSPRYVRRAGLVTFVISLALVVLALKYGVEVKGSRRWILGLQPSEFLKPAFVILAAWAFAEGGEGAPMSKLSRRAGAGDLAADDRAADP